MSQEQFIKSIIRQRIKITDPELYYTVEDIIYKFITLLQYGDDSLRRNIVDIILQALPDEVTSELIRRYIDKVKRRYSMIKDIMKELGFDISATKGKGMEDMFIGFMLEMFKNQYFTQPRYHDTTQSTNATENIDAKELPEELKQILKKQ